MKTYHAAEEIADVYNQFGRAYHQSRADEGRFFNESLEMPAILSLLSNDLTGQRYLMRAVAREFIHAF